MAKVKSYISKPGQPKPTPAPGATKGDGKVYAGGPGFRELNNLTPGTRKRKERGISNPIGVKPRNLRKKVTEAGKTKPTPKPFDLRKEKQLPRKPLNKSGLKKDGPGGKKGYISMSVKKPLLISRKKIGGR